MTLIYLLLFLPFERVILTVLSHKIQFQVEKKGIVFAGPLSILWKSGCAIFLAYDVLAGRHECRISMTGLGLFHFFYCP